MTGRNGVLLVTGEPTTERAVMTALVGSASLEAVGICHDMEALVMRLQDRSVPLVLVDIDRRPAEMLRDLERLAARFRETRFVVLSSELRNDLVLEAMQAGARHFLLKASLGENLAGVLQRFADVNGASPESRGSITTVLSVSGGCGATTIAVNLANEAQLASSDSVLLVDLDVAYGSVGTYLDLRGGYGIADLLASTRRVDAELVRSTSVAWSENLHVLLSPVSVRFADPAPLNYETLEDSLKACKHAYGYTVVDAPRVPVDVAATLARTSRLVLLVFQLTVKDLRFARAFWAALAERGVPRERVLAVANRFRKRRQMVPLAEVEKALPGLRIETMRNDYRATIRGLNFGQPLSQIARRSPFRRGIEDLVDRFVLRSVNRS